MAAALGIVPLGPDRRSAKFDRDPALIFCKQISYSMSLSVPFHQGYLVAIPISVDALAEFLE